MAAANADESARYERAYLHFAAVFAFAILKMKKMRKLVEEYDCVVFYEKEQEDMEISCTL